MVSLEIIPVHVDESNAFTSHGQSLGGPNNFRQAVLFSGRVGSKEIHVAFQNPDFSLPLSSTVRWIPVPPPDPQAAVRRQEMTSCKQDKIIPRLLFSCRKRF